VAILVGTGLGTLAVYDVAHKYFAQGASWANLEVHSYCWVR